MMWCIRELSFLEEIWVKSHGAFACLPSNPFQVLRIVLVNFAQSDTFVLAKRQNEVLGSFLLLTDFRLVGGWGGT